MGGRPPKYRAEACQVAERGATQPEIADVMGVTNRTLSRWALKYPEFRAALDRGLVRREAKRRWAETAPLRAAAAQIHRLIADAIGSQGSADRAKVDGGPVMTQRSTASDTNSTQVRDLGTLLGREERRAARYTLPDPERDLAFDGEPVELLDPRLCS